MKTYYLLFLSIFFLLANSFAQSPFKYLNSEGDARLVKSRTGKNKALGDTLYYEDFSTGGPGGGQLAAGWTRSNNAGNTNDWIWSTTAPGGQYTSIGPLANTISGTNPPIPTSAQNGFMVLPSDLYNTPTPAGGFINMDASFQSPPITIANPPAAVLLQFTHALRWNGGAGNVIGVEVSTDGVNWSAPYDAKNGNAVNYSSGNAELVTIDVSAELAFASTVYIRFIQSGASHYYWMIDDVLLLEGLSNAFKINDLTLNFSDTFQVNPIYTQVPLDMVDSISTTTEIENIGAYDQNGVKVDYRVYHDSSLSGLTGNGLVFQDSVVYNQAFTAKDKDTILFDSPKFKPSQNGYYRTVVNISSDSTNQISNLSSKSQSFVVSDTILSRDKGVFAGSFSVFTGLGTTLVDSNKVGVLINGGAIPKSIKALQFYVSSNLLSLGAKIRPMLWEINYNGSNLNSAIQLKAQDTTVLIITNAMLDSWIQLPFSVDPTLSNLNLQPGKQYLIGWEQVNGSNGSNFSVGRDFEMQLISPQQSNFEYLNNQNPNWYWTASVPAIRGVFGINPVGLNKYTYSDQLIVYPNPTQDNLSVKWDRSKQYNNLTLTDIKGKVLYEKNLVKGQNKHKLKLNHLEKGVYLILLEGSKSKAFSKVVVY